MTDLRRGFREAFLHVFVATFQQCPFFPPLTSPNHFKTSCLSCSLWFSLWLLGLIWVHALRRLKQVWNIWYWTWNEFLSSCFAMEDCPNCCNLTFWLHSWDILFFKKILSHSFHYLMQIYPANFVSEKLKLRECECSTSWNEACRSS